MPPRTSAQKQPQSQQRSSTHLTRPVERDESKPIVSATLRNFVYQKKSDQGPSEAMSAWRFEGSRRDSILLVFASLLLQFRMYSEVS